MQYKVAMFGEAEKGQFQKPYHCRCLEQLMDCLGNPPKESSGLILAIQTLLFEYDVLFFRVHQEGFSIEDYLLGLKYLEKNYGQTKVDAVGIPGVGDEAILKETNTLCHIHKSFLIITEKDLYDYLTSKSP